MTIAGWVIFGIIALLVICGAIWIAVEADSSVASVITVLIAILIIAGVFFGMRWYFNNTAAGSRAIKTQQSSLNNGIERTVRVYDVNGQLIQRYEGKFDVDYDDNRIIFDDEYNKRHIIYYPTGTIIIDEK